MLNINKPVRTVKGEESGQDIEQQRDFFFRALVQARLAENTTEILEDVGFSDEEIDEFTDALSKLSEDDLSAALAVPYEVRERIFGAYERRIRQGELSPTQAVADLVAKNREAGVTLGYHLSRLQIPKQKTPDGTHWIIRGTEFDDRDNMPMAYYSEDYLHRYQTKGGRFLYVVRSERGNNSSHKRDLDNRWSRARALAIIDEYDMAEIEEKIDEKMRKEKDNAAPLREAAS